MFLRHWIKHVLATALAVALCAGIVVDSEVLDSVQSIAADRMLRLASWFPPDSPEAFPQVVIVAMDDEAVDDPFPRAQLADAIQRLDEAGARSITLNLDLSERGGASAGQRLARSGRVVLAQADDAPPPHASFARGASEIGRSSLPLDADGVVRRISNGRPGDGLAPLGQAVLQVALRDDASAERASPVHIDACRRC